MNRIVCKKGMYTYTMSETTISYEEFGEIVMFGITVFDKNKIFEVEDISPDYEFVHSLFVLIVGLGLHPEHFYDVVDDYINDHSPKVVTLKMPLKHPFTA